MNDDLFIHLEHAQRLAQAPDFVVFQVERRCTAQAKICGMKRQRCRNRGLTGDAMDDEAAVQHHTQGVSGGYWRGDAGQLESDDGKLLRLHRLIEIPIAALVSGRECADRRLHPATDLGKLTALHLASDSGCRAREFAGCGVRVKAQSTTPDSAVRNGAHRWRLSGEGLP